MGHPASGSSTARATSAPPKQRYTPYPLGENSNLIPYIDHMGRMCIPHAHGTGWCTWHDGGFHKFDPNSNVPHSVPSHCNTSAYLRSIRDNRLFREEKKKAAFAETFHSCREDKANLRESNKRYGSMMGKILIPEAPLIERIKAADRAPKANLKEILKELHDRNRAEKQAIKEKIKAATM
ncbi:unnamed protein product [Amoebophrya sp. A120]|nr:unnamed protein product [Amoebophrya sp. A120]|eukprot:GSA120T00019506001.1